MAIWYPSSGLTWTQPLQAESLPKDPRAAAQRSSSVIPDQTSNLVASNQQIAQSFGQTFDEADGCSEMCLRAVEQSIQDLSSHIRGLRGDFAHNFSLPIDRLQIQNGLLTGLIGRFDAIRSTLKEPNCNESPRVPPDRA